MSIKKVIPQKATFKKELNLECGRILPSFEMVYETYGKLNNSKNNAILICHALSGNHHAAGLDRENRKGWWNELIGPGKAIDTDRFFVVSPNNLGGCHGTTGPTSIDPISKKPFGPDFPVITVLDWVNSQLELAKYLEINSWYAVIGGSLGGMQALQWSITYPNKVKKSAIIAAAPKLSAQNIAFNEVARQAIISDPEFKKGRYLEQAVSPKKGLGLARMVGHITYLSDEAMRTKFGRELREGKLNFGFGVDFQIESYLRHQGDVFSDTFDANTYLLMTKLLDYFDPALSEGGDLVKTFNLITAKILVVSFTTDWRFSPKRSKEIVNALLAAKKQVSYIEVNSSRGHDSFLFAEKVYVKALKAFLN